MSLRSFEYLEQLRGTTFLKLYRQPSTALAIFRRMLPHLAKTFVMAMLYIHQPFLSTDLDAWVKSEEDSKRKKESAISLLKGLYILSENFEPGKPRSYKLTNPFAQSLRLALTGGGKHRSFGVPCNVPHKHRVDINFLDAFARSQWESILHYMVGSAGVGSQPGSKGPSAGVTTILRLGGLVEIMGGHPEITQDGFAFLLEEVNAQVWKLLDVYLENAEAVHQRLSGSANEGSEMDSVDRLSFLFMLGSLELDQDYSIAALSQTQIRMLDYLHDFGIIYRPEPKSKCFYPTRLATTLTSDAGASRNVGASFDTGMRSAESKGFIVIETNYRIYAYTSSPLQMEILGLFTKLGTRYPNMVSGKITRQSIRRAIAKGITSDQIISYLSTHAHPQMRKMVPVLPPTVVDQIRLWQIESQRMKTTSGVLLKDFLTMDEYQVSCRYAEEIGVLVWKSDHKRMCFVTRHQQVAAYLNGLKKEGKLS